MDLSQRRDMTQGIQYSTGSFELVFGAALVAAAGFGLDILFGTTPWFTLVFALVGFVTVTIRIFLGYRFNMSRQAEARDEADRAFAARQRATP